MASLIWKLGADTTEFSSKVGGAQGVVDKFKSALGAIGLTLGTTAVLGWFKSIIEWGSKLTDVADKIGVTTEFLQKFRFAAEQVGLNVNTADMALQRFTRRLGEAQQGTGEALGVFEQYNIQLRNTDGTARSAEEVLGEMADTIAGAESSMEQLRIAFKLFDSEGAGMVALMKLGKEGMEEMFQAAEDLGLILEDETARKLDAMADGMAALSIKSKVLGADLIEYAASFGSMIQSISNAWQSAAEGITDTLFGGETPEWLKTIQDVATFSPIGWMAEQFNKGAEAGEKLEVATEAVAAASAEVADDQKEAAAAAKEHEKAQKLIEGALKKQADFAFDQLSTSEKIEIVRGRLIEVWADLNSAGLTELEYAELSAKYVDDKIALTKLEVAAAEEVNAEREAEIEKQEKLKDLLEEKADLEGQILDLQAAQTAEIFKRFGIDLENLDPSSGLYEGSLGTISQNRDAAEGSATYWFQLATKRAVELSEMTSSGDFTSGQLSDAQQAYADAQNNYIKYAQTSDQLQSELYSKTGLEQPENPLKTALKETEDKLDDINDEIKKL